MDVGEKNDIKETIPNMADVKEENHKTVQENRKNAKRICVTEWLWGPLFKALGV